MSLRIVDILDRRHVIPGVVARDKAGLLYELAERAALACKIDEAQIAAALTAREQLGSTGVGGGIAIPHARVAGLAAPFAMFARVEPAVDFAAIDGHAVDLVFMVLTPADGAAVHLSLLAAIARLLRNPATVMAVRQAAHAGAIYEVLTKTP